MLSVTHTGACAAAAFPTDMIQLKDIRSHASLADRFVKPAMSNSKFYGCFTSKFAKEWKDVFGVPAEGAVNKIDFGTIDSPSPISNVLTRIEQTHTSLGSPDWKIHK